MPQRGKANRGTTVRTDGAGMTFHRLTFSYNGAAQSFNAAAKVAGKAPVVEECRFTEQYAMQDDGAFVEGGGAPAKAPHKQGDHSGL